MLQDVTNKQFDNFYKLCRCAEWCKAHNVKLIELDVEGFYFSNGNDKEFIRYDEM